MIFSVFFVSAALFSEPVSDSWTGSASFLNRARIAGVMTASQTSGEPGETAGVKRTPGTRKPGAGILMSAVLPGTGEFYAGAWLKGIAFLAAEGLLWTGYAVFWNDGQDKEEAFHAYADLHWSREQWENLYSSSDPSTHSLPPTKTQQYYEMIGKYDQFAKGWDDWFSGGPALTPNRDAYESMRHDSNVQFKRASYCAMGVLFNHLASAFDAAWTIHSRNRRIESSLSMEMKPVRSDIVPFMTLRLAWSLSY